MIDENKLIEEMKKLKQEVNMPVDIVWNNLLKVCIDTVNEQPKVGEWIPVDKITPAKEQEVEISCIYRYIGAGNEKKEARFTAGAFYTDGTMTTEDSKFAWVQNAYLMELSSENH